MSNFYCVHLGSNSLDDYSSGIYSGSNLSIAFKLSSIIFFMINGYSNLLLSIQFPYKLYFTPILVDAFYTMRYTFLQVMFWMGCKFLVSFSFSAVLAITILT